MPPTGDLACNPGMCPDWESNWRPFGLQAGTQPTEPPLPGPQIALALRTHYLKPSFPLLLVESSLFSYFTLGTQFIGEFWGRWS